MARIFNLEAAKKGAVIKDQNGRQYKFVAHEPYHRGYSFITNHYDYANHYAPGMIVFDLENWKFTDDGLKWQEIEEDHL